MEVINYMLVLLREYQMGAYGELDDDYDKRMIAALIELYEQLKPKPEPVAYKVCNPAGCVLVESRKSAEKLSSEYGNGTYQPLYTTPTREPLSEEQRTQIKRKLYGIKVGFDFDEVVDAIEQAHGIT